VGYRGEKINMSIPLWMGKARYMIIKDQEGIDLWKKYIKKNHVELSL
jgi:hypothetical protein